MTLVLTALVLACSREAEIYDGPDVYVPPAAPDQQLEIPSVSDAGLDSEDFAECGDRPEGDCRGGNDFVCAFDDFAESVIDECFQHTDCMASGWVSLTLDDQGCASDIGMENVDQAFVSCVVETLGQLRCPCSNSTYKQFLGGTSQGCNTDDAPLQ